jgi:hypothetical protein
MAVAAHELMPQLLASDESNRDNAGGSPSVKILKPVRRYRRAPRKKPPRFPAAAFEFCGGQLHKITAAIRSAYAKRPPFPAAVFYEQTSCWGEASLAGLAATYSSKPWGLVPLALGSFTAEFEMGSGTGPPLKPPGRPRTFEARSLSFSVCATLSF